MVIRLFFLILLAPLFLFSGEFTASVSRNQINLGESLSLQLTLKEATAKSAPVVDPLRNAFSVTSQQQLFNTTMINGKVTSYTTWKLTLIPLNEGEVQIPSINIDTSEGILSSQPIKINVIKRSLGSNLSEASDLILTTEVTKAKPYKNEPVIYTIRLVSKNDLVDIKMQMINLEDAIVETHGEPKIYKKILDGVSVNVIEMDYLITPLKAGSLKIPSTLVQGAIPAKRKTHHGLSFDDDFDPFAMMLGVQQLKPFAMTTEEMVLDVLPAIVGINPWLPAKSLKIEEVWNDSQTLKQGEPFTRGFKIIAEGIKSSQIPSLNEQLMSDHQFKIYADKPELVDEGADGNVRSNRKEQYTIIPQQSGTLTLSELSITWWDVTKNEKVVTRVPSKTLQILAAPDHTNTQLPTIVNDVKEVANSPETQLVVVKRDPILYAVIIVLSMLLFGVIIWGIILQRKIVHYKESTKSEKQVKKTSAPKNKQEKLPDLNPT